MKLLDFNIKLILFSIILSFSSSILSQNESQVCSTTTSEKFIEYYNSIKNQLSVFEQDFKLAKSNKTKNSKKDLNYIPIKAHIIRSEDGSTGLTEKNLEVAIANLNEIYAQAFMKFFLFEGINYIDNNELSNFRKGNEKSLITANYVPNTINIYFIDSIENALGESICGYVEQKVNIIIMKNSCSVNDSSLAHEMGHFFSLIHTHGASNTKLTSEFVDGSNCDTDGDGICDTPADPKLSYDTIDNNCNYIGNLTDAHGDVYEPDTKNIMSYSRKSCRSNFTEQQFTRIYAYYKSMGDKLRSDFSDDYFAIDKLAKVKIYPNPVSNGKIHLKSVVLESEPVYYQIANFQGQTLSNGIISNGEINVNHLSSGSYLLILNDSNTKVVKKFIK
ncbi:T9SS type A sorting domain-containing protein [Litoribaculum gwangyangense]|uniref:T9SS type A sorting domain-containing protein n=1 Tax=Litoribaculum gwangyangense TaxID=1130722 RepID=UPI0031E6A56A